MSVDEGGDRVVAGSVTDVLVAFGQWLDRQRGLAPVTVGNNCWGVEQFLGTLPPPVGVSIGLLGTDAVTAFMIEFCRDRNTTSAKSMARSLRSFLRFAHATGRTSIELWSAVPSSASWHQASLPKAVPADQVERLLRVAAGASVTVGGRRDYAILVLLARLGLRRGEVAAMGRTILTGGPVSSLSRVRERASNGCRCLLSRVRRSLAWLCDGHPSCSTLRCSARCVRPGAGCLPGRSNMSFGLGAAPL